MAAPGTASGMHGSAMAPGGRALPQAFSFWLLAALLTLFLFAASAPSPLYAAYQSKWHFSSITLTAVYAVYAFGALVALLTTGRVSDYVGRRRVTILGLAIQIAGMLAFVVAEGVEWLYLARILQGAGTGIATGALSAWLLDLQPPDRPRLGSLVGGIAVISGLALGAFGAGLLAQYAPDPLHLVFWLLALLYALALGATAFVPDVVERRPGWLGALRPEVEVLPSARSLFVALVPSLIASWAVAGLYLSLGPSLAIALTHTQNRVAGGLVVLGLLGTGAVASFLTRQADPGAIVLRGSLVLIAGVGLTLVAVALGSPAGLYAASVVAGLGFGPAFSGVLRSLAPLAPPDRRGALLASIYVVLYLAFSLPTIAAGGAVGAYGLRGTTYAYGLLVMVLAASTTVALLRRAVPAQAAA